MKKIMIIFAAVVVPTTISLLIVLNNIRHRDLVIGSAPTMAPFTYVIDEDIVGFDIAIAKEIAKDKNRPAKVQFMYFSQLIDALQKGDIDIIASVLTITEERKKIIDFSEPYYANEMVALIRKDRLAEFEGVTTRQELGKNRKIAAQTGTLSVDFMLEITTAQNAIRSRSWDDAILALVDGVVDTVIINEIGSRKYLQLHDEVMILPITNMWQLEYGIGVKKGNYKLRNSINKTLNRLQLSGDYQKLIDEHVENYRAK